MRKKGLVRLWIVLTALGVPVAAVMDFQQKQHFWHNLDKVTVQQCVDEEYNDPAHPDALECSRRAGTEKTVFEREDITPMRYWAGALGGAFIADLILTALLAAVFFTVRWVWRGFRSNPPAETR